MHFMFLILVFLLCTVVWGFFHSNPQGVSARALLACNIVMVVLAVALAGVTATVLHADALTVREGQRAMAIYLAIMAGGTVFMIVLAVGGLLRNLLLFPLSRRAAPPAGDKA